MHCIQSIPAVSIPHSPSPRQLWDICSRCEPGRGGGGRRKDTAGIDWHISASSHSHISYMWASVYKYFDVHVGQDKIQRISKNKHTIRCYPWWIKCLLTYQHLAFFGWKRQTLYQIMLSLVANKMLIKCKHEMSATQGVLGPCLGVRVLPRVWNPDLV